MLTNGSFRKTMSEETDKRFFYSYVYCWYFRIQNNLGRKKMQCIEFAYKLAVNGKTSPFYFIVAPYFKKNIYINLRQIIILGPQNSKNLLLSNFKLEFNIFRILSHSSGYNRYFFIAKKFVCKHLPSYTPIYMLRYLF